jgi:hypothetical protein
VAWLSLSKATTYIGHVFEVVRTGPWCGVAFRLRETQKASFGLTSWFGERPHDIKRLLVHPWRHG